MKGKKGNHLPPETQRRKKSKPNQQAPPLDPAADFDTPTRKEPEQQKLLDVPAKQPDPIVVNGYMSAKFLKPHPERETSGAERVGFEISLALTPEHREKKLLPARILEAWDIVTKHGYPSLSVDGIPTQTVNLAVAADAIEKHTALKMLGAEIENANISVIEETGSGEAVKVFRLKFRVKADIDDQNWRWARVNFQKIIWLKMQATQARMLEEEAA